MMMHNEELKGAPAVGSPLDGVVRPLRWLCQSCGWNGGDAELLRAISPFDAAETIVGCPKCKTADDIANACDDPECAQKATCGFPAQGGYRRTCDRHSQWRDKRHNAEFCGPR